MKSEDERTSQCADIFLPLLPPEIWKRILSIIGIPLCFKYCAVNRRWNEMIHQQLRNIGIVNVQRYVKMNPSRNIQQQMRHLVQRNNHYVGGIIVDGPVDMEQLFEVLKYIFVSDMGSFKQFDYLSSAATSFCDSIGIPRGPDGIINLTSAHAANLTILALNLEYYRERCHLYLRPFTALKELKVCYALIVEWPNVALSSVTIKCCCSNTSAELMNILSVSAEVLEILTLRQLTFDDCSLVAATICLPNAKLVAVEDLTESRQLSRSLVFDLSSARLLQDLELSGKELTVVSPNNNNDGPNLTSLTTMEVPYGTFDFLQGFINPACLETMNFKDQITEEILTSIWNLFVTEFTALVSVTVTTNYSDRFCNIMASMLISEILVVCPTIKCISFIGYTMANADIVDVITRVLCANLESLETIQFSYCYCKKSMVVEELETSLSGQSKRKSPLNIKSQWVQRCGCCSSNDNAVAPDDNNELSIKVLNLYSRYNINLTTYPV